MSINLQSQTTLKTHLYKVVTSTKEWILYICYYFLNTLIGLKYIFVFIEFLHEIRHKINNELSKKIMEKILDYSSI